MEQWRIIPGFEGYAVSNLGRVRGKRAHFLKPFPAKYLQVTLYNAGGRETAAIHRLVCEAFHGPRPSPLHEVAHTDGDRHNNAASNLRWSTHAQNEADKLAHGTALKGKPSLVPADRQARGATHGRSTKPWRTARGERARSKLTEQKVLAIRADQRPRRQLAEEHGVTIALIGMIQNRKVWSHI